MNKNMENIFAGVKIDTAATLAAILRDHPELLFSHAVFDTKPVFAGEKKLQPWEVEIPQWDDPRHGEGVVSVAAWEVLIDAAGHNHRVDAIKKLRSFTNAHLKEAKDFVDKHWEHLKEIATQRYGMNHHPRGE